MEPIYIKITIHLLTDLVFAFSVVLLHELVHAFTAFCLNVKVKEFTVTASGHVDLKHWYGIQGFFIALSAPIFNILFAFWAWENHFLACYVAHSCAVASTIQEDGDFERAFYFLKHYKTQFYNP